MQKIQIIAVDFDGTLCNDCYPNIGYPNMTLIQQLKALRQNGKRVILWTCRCGKKLTEAIDWCRDFGLEFDAVNANVPEILEQYETESRKISADVYIDDKSCFPRMLGEELLSTMVADKMINIVSTPTQGIYGTTKFVTRQIGMLEQF